MVIKMYLTYKFGKPIDLENWLLFCERLNIIYNAKDNRFEYRQDYFNSNIKIKIENLPIDSMVDKIKLYNLYAKETRKFACWGEGETKQFLKWKQKKYANRHILLKERCSKEDFKKMINDYKQETGKNALNINKTLKEGFLDWIEKSKKIDLMPPSNDPAKHKITGFDIEFFDKSKLFLLEILVMEIYNKYTIFPNWKKTSIFCKNFREDIRKKIIIRNKIKEGYYFIGDQLTQNIRENWKEYLQVNDMKRFWGYTEDFAKELFLSGYFWGNDYRMQVPFITPIENKPLLLYFFRNTLDGKSVLSDSGATIRQIKTIKLKNPITDSEMEKIKDILKMTGCRFHKWSMERAIISIEIKTKPYQIAINTLKIGQAILMIYGIFSKDLKKFEEACNMGMYSDAYQQYVNRWNDLAYE
jgi:hypothetical protein